MTIYLYMKTDQQICTSAKKKFMCTHSYHGLLFLMVFSEPTKYDFPCFNKFCASCTKEK